MLKLQRPHGEFQLYPKSRVEPSVKKVSDMIGFGLKDYFDWIGEEERAESRHDGGLDQRGGSVVKYLQVRVGFRSGLTKCFLPSSLVTYVNT